MFHYGVENGPEFVGNECFGASEYPSGQNISSLFDLTRDSGYGLARNLDRPPVRPATESSSRRFPRPAEYRADEARQFVASQRGDETVFVYELDDLILSLESKIEFESMLSDPYRFRFPNQLSCVRVGTYLILEKRESLD